MTCLEKLEISALSGKCQESDQKSGVWVKIFLEKLFIICTLLYC